MIKTNHGFNMSQIWSGIYLPTWPTVVVAFVPAVNLK